MNADIAFAKGKTHPVCQDYAVAHVTDTCASVLVSDGCSGSPLTDFGARILSQCALNNLSLLRDDSSPTSEANREAFLTATAHDASGAARLLKLPPQCLDATLMIVRADAESYHAEVHGDGAIVIFGVSLSRRNIFDLELVGFSDRGSWLTK